MPVGKGLLSGGMRRRGDVRAVVHAAVLPLLMLEIDAPHVPFQIGKEPGKALLVAPDVRAGRLAAAVGTLPAESVSIGDAKYYADVAQDGRLRGEAVEQPVGERAVVEGLVERSVFSRHLGKAVTASRITPAASGQRVA